MGCAAVEFDYTKWIASYPEFGDTDPALAEVYFEQASIIWRNDGTGPVSKPNVQLLLLNMLTAHIAALNVQSQGDTCPGTTKDANTPVGRISSATEGSVSIGTEYNAGASQSQQFAYFSQTRYGAQFWASTSQYRRARYIHGYLQPGGLGPFGPGYGGFGNGGLR